MAKPRRVAIVIDPEWPLKHHQETIVGIERYAEEHNNWQYAIDLFAHEVLDSRRGHSAYDGIIARATPKLAAQARQARVPLVNIWYNSPVRGLPAVLPDLEAAARIAAEYLMARGLRNFAHINFHGDPATELEASTFRAALAARGFSCSIHPVYRNYCRNGASWRKFKSGLCEWIASWPRPIGIYICADVISRYMTIACRQEGIRIPEDAAIVSAPNELTYCLQSKPSLTSLDHNFMELGYRAAAMLDRLMDGDSPPTIPEFIRPELIMRQSTETFTASDPLVARAMHFIADHDNGRLQASDVASSLHVSRRTLDRRFHEATGRGVASEMARLRIERVKQQLLGSDATTKTLAISLGFGTTKRLCEAFHRIEGISPGEYREKHRV